MALDGKKAAAASLSEKAEKIRGNVIHLKNTQLQILDSIIRMMEIEHQAIVEKINSLESNDGTLGITVPTTSGGINGAGGNAAPADGGPG